MSLAPDEAGRAVNALASDDALKNAAATLYAFCTDSDPPLELTVLNASSLQTLAASGARDPAHKQPVADLAKMRRKPLAIAAALRSGIRSTVSSALDALVIAIEGAAPGTTDEQLDLAVALAQEVSVLIGPALTAGKITANLAARLQNYPLGVQTAAIDLIEGANKGGMTVLDFRTASAGLCVINTARSWLSATRLGRCSGCCDGCRVSRRLY